MTLKFVIGTFTEVLKECTQLRNQLEVSQTKSLEKQKEDNSAHGQSQLLKQKFQVNHYNSD